MTAYDCSGGVGTGNCNGKAVLQDGDTVKTSNANITFHGGRDPGAQAAVRPDGTTVKDPRTGSAMLVPKGVSMRAIGDAGAAAKGGPGLPEAYATVMFQPGGRWDFQRTMSGAGGRLPDGAVRVDQRYVAAGNYAFGVFAAKSGMPRWEALGGAAAVFMRNGRPGGGFGGMGNPKNEDSINAVYNDALSGNLPN